MKGLVFTEFLEMVESNYGFEVMEGIIEDAELPSGGAYTSVGTYQYSEMVSLVTQLSNKVGVPVEGLLQAYGKYLFKAFETRYPGFLKSAPSAFDFFESIDQHIHVEVKKLYPDAELPAFSSRRLSDHSLELIYSSERKMGAFALGLIEGSLLFYNESASISMEPQRMDGSVVRFVIEKHPDT